MTSVSADHMIPRHRQKAEAGAGADAAVYAGQTHDLLTGSRALHRLSYRYPPPPPLFPNRNIF